MKTTARDSKGRCPLTFCLFGGGGGGGTREETRYLWNSVYVCFA